MDGYRRHSKRILVSLVRIQKHDRYQLELKFEYLSSAKGAEEVELDLWLFLPPVFGLSSGMYSSSQVYTDLRVYGVDACRAGYIGHA